MEKDRKNSRKPLKVYLSVYNEKNGEMLGYLVDITREGFMLTNEQPVIAGETFRLKLDLPAKIEGTKAFFFNATSLWNEKDSETDFYNTGFQFGETSENEVKIIDHLIEKYCFKT